MSYRQALALGRRYDQKGLPMRAVLAVVTAPGSYTGNPGIPGAVHKPLRNWLAWVVTTTFPKPINDLPKADQRQLGRPSATVGSTSPAALSHHP